MTFNKEYMQKKSNEFWDAYFKLLELKHEDIGKIITETPLVREIDIDEKYSLKVGRNATRWDLVYKRWDDIVVEVLEVDDATRAFRLLHNYLDRVV